MRMGDFGVHCCHPPNTQEQLDPAQMRILGARDFAPYSRKLVPGLPDHVNSEGVDYMVDIGATRGIDEGTPGRQQ
jgi:hypothetical protein